MGGVTGRTLSETHDESNREPLTTDEVQLIRGTLAMSVKKVSDHLTPIDKVFALEQDTLLDAQQLARLRQYGHSRIPVYQGTLDDVVGVLLVKSLVGVANPTQPARVRDFKLQPIITLSATYGLYDALHNFQTGRSHLAVVKEENADGDSRTVGIITMEDILEELFLAEIQDETDLDKLRRSSTRWDGVTNERDRERADSDDELGRARMGGCDGRPSDDRLAHPGHRQPAKVEQLQRSRSLTLKRTHVKPAQARGGRRLSPIDVARRLRAAALVYLYMHTMIYNARERRDKGKGRRERASSPCSRCPTSCPTCAAKEADPGFGRNELPIARGVEQGVLDRGPLQLLGQAAGFCLGVWQGPRPRPSWSIRLHRQDAGPVLGHGGSGRGSRGGDLGDVRLDDQAGARPGVRRQGREQARREHAALVMARLEPRVRKEDRHARERRCERLAAPRVQEAVQRDVGVCGHECDAGGEGGRPPCLGSAHECLADVDAQEVRLGQHLGQAAQECPWLQGASRRERA